MALRAGRDGRGSGLPYDGAHQRYYWNGLRFTGLRDDGFTHLSLRNSKCIPGQNEPVLRQSNCDCLKAVIDASGAYPLLRLFSYGRRQAHRSLTPCGQPVQLLKQSRLHSSRRYTFPRVQRAPRPRALVPSMAHPTSTTITSRSIKSQNHRPGWRYFYAYAIRFISTPSTVR
ncbi:hypothetical protein BDZ89DRAFT_1070078 [Hymenopellis radicata]|nr:hypothetical protein BDZ89DRAFT_1070078 [Hymenopellis radicata]